MRCAIFALLIALLSPLSALSNATKTGVTFVSSDEELNFALVIFDRDEIDSLAVSQTFYLGTAKQTKDRIRGLIAGVQARKNGIIYLHDGLPHLPPGEVILGVKLPIHCDAILATGKALRTGRVASYQCASGSGATTKAEVRAEIRKFDDNLRR